MTDAFATVGNVEWGPYENAAAVTPHDTTPLVAISRALYIGGAGNVTATVGGVNVLFTALPVGTILPVRCTKVLSTGTTATAIVALS